MQRKNQGVVRAVIAATLAAALVAVSIPASAVDAPELPAAPPLPVGGSLHAAIAGPSSGSAFSRIDTIHFLDGSQADGCDIQSWYWEFGDGKWDLHQAPTHKYAALGDYTVKLTVVGACGDVDSATLPLSIVNLPPVAALSISPAAPAAGDTVTFDASQSSDPDGLVTGYLFTIDSDAHAAQAGATLSQAFTQAGQHVAQVRAQDNDDGVGPAVSVAFSIAPGPLASLGISPASAQVPAGGALQLAARGLDAHGNDVAVSPVWAATCGSIDAQGLFHAPTQAGPCSVSAQQDAFHASASLDVVPGPLAHLDIAGPDSVVVDSIHTYDLHGSDAYGNPVALIQSSVLYHAPQQAGAGQVCASEQGISQCKAVQLLPDALASIALSGPASLTAGSAASFAVSGADRFGNAVPLAQASLAYAAPQHAGPAQACYAEQGVQGCKLLDITAGPLASIALVGPDSVRAGHHADYALQGSDAYGNAVPLAQSMLGWDAPTGTGAQQVCYGEQGVQGCKPVQVIADSLASITVSGPGQLVAGQAGTYQLSGTDAYGNAAQLAQGSMQFGSTRAGATQACYTEQGISGCQPVDIVPAALGSIVVSGPDQLVAGAHGSYALAGYDAYANPVGLAQATLDYAAPTTAGPAQACYAEQGVQGCAPVSIVHGALSSIAVSGPADVPAGATAHYSVLGSDAYGNAVPLAQPGFDWTAPSVSGPAQACYAEQGVQGCLAVNVGTAPLSRIDVSGPASLVAGSSATYTFAGFDAFGNSMPLAQGSTLFTAPTQAGPAQVCYSEQGVQGCKAVQVLAGSLASIAVSGPGSVPAGAGASFGLAGSDAYGNGVPLAQASLAWTAPTAAGPAQVCYTESGIQGCAAVQVVPAALASILVTGPDQLVAGAHGSYALAGFDAYQNSVALLQPSLDFVATQAGPAQACYAEQGVQGCAGVTILAAALHDIAVSGPDSVVAGQAATFGLAGSDAYGNAVPLAPSSIGWTAPQQAGDQQVCDTQQGVQGCKLVHVVHDALLTITVSGPAQLAAGQSASYALSGADQYGNPVALAQSALPFTAPTAAPGTSPVCYTEQGATGCLDVGIVAGALRSIAVSGPDGVPAGQGATFSLAGFDAYANSVPLAQTSLAWTAPTQAGPAQACYAEQGVEGCHALMVLAGPLASIALSGPDAVPAAGHASYALSGADPYGNPVPLAQPSLAFDAPTVAGVQHLCYAEQGVQGCKDVQVVHGPLERITLSGPASLAAGSSADYALQGLDHWQNAVPLAQAALHYTAPQLAGPAQACYAEQGVQGCAPVSIVAGPLARLQLSPAALVVNLKQKDVAYSAKGSDQYGNPVALPGSPVWSTNLGAISASGLYSPTQAGTGQVQAKVGSVVGKAQVQVVKDLAMRVYTANPSYHNGQAIRGVAHAAFADGSPAAYTLVTVVIHQANPSHVGVDFQGVNSDDALRSTTVQGRTNNFGDFAWSAPDSYNMPGDYHVDASGVWNGNSGHAATDYHVDF